MHAASTEIPASVAPVVLHHLEVSAREKQSELTKLEKELSDLKKAISSLRASIGAPPLFQSRSEAKPNSPAAVPGKDAANVATINSFLGKSGSEWGVKDISRGTGLATSTIHGVLQRNEAVFEKRPSGKWASKQRAA